MDYIAFRYDCAVEIGIGYLPDVALALADRGVRIFATDIKPFSYAGIRVVVDDVTKADLSLYATIDILYSLRPPPELVPYMNKLAKRVAADLIVKPLGSEYCEGRLTHHGNATFFLWKYA